MATLGGGGEYIEWLRWGGGRVYRVATLGGGGRVYRVATLGGELLVSINDM